MNRGIMLGDAGEFGAESGQNVDKSTPRKLR
jgi:hypothetical protein